MHISADNQTLQVAQQRRYLPASMAVGIIDPMAAGEDKRGKVTDENREESRRLRAIWQSRRAELAARGLFFVLMLCNFAHSAFFISAGIDIAG